MQAICSSTHLLLAETGAFWVARTEQCSRCHWRLSGSAFISGMFGAAYSNSGGGCQHFIARSYSSLESSTQQNEAGRTRRRVKMRWNNLRYARGKIKPQPRLMFMLRHILKCSSLTETPKEVKHSKDQDQACWGRGSLSLSSVLDNLHHMSLILDIMITSYSASCCILWELIKRLDILHSWW